MSTSRMSASDRRQLLPRIPPDGVVLALIVIGVVTIAAAPLEPVVALAPGAIAAVVQKVGGHVRASRSRGVERAFVVESAALAFFVSLLLVGGVVVLQALGVIGDVPAGAFLLGALFVDTTVRSARESRFT